MTKANLSDQDHPLIEVTRPTHALSTAIAKKEQRMNLKYTVLLASGLLVGSAVAYSASSADRRTFLSKSITSGLVPAFLSTPTMAATDDELVTASDDGFITTESGLRYKVITVGNGAIPAPGQTVKAHYTGRNL